MGRFGSMAVLLGALAAPVVEAWGGEGETLEEKVTELACKSGLCPLSDLDKDFTKYVFLADAGVDVRKFSEEYNNLLSLASGNEKKVYLRPDSNNPNLFSAYFVYSLSEKKPDGSVVFEGFDLAMDPSQARGERTTEFYSSVFTDGSELFVVLPNLIEIPPSTKEEAKSTAVQDSQVPLQEVSLTTSDAVKGVVLSKNVPVMERGEVQRRKDFGLGIACGPKSQASNPYNSGVVGDCDLSADVEVNGRWDLGVATGVAFDGNHFGLSRLGVEASHSVGRKGDFSLGIGDSWDPLDGYRGTPFDGVPYVGLGGNYYFGGDGRGAKFFLGGSVVNALARLDSVGIALSDTDFEGHFGVGIGFPSPREREVVDTVGPVRISSEKAQMVELKAQTKNQTLTVQPLPSDVKNAKTQPSKEESIKGLLTISESEKRQITDLSCKNAIKLYLNLARDDSSLNIETVKLVADVAGRQIGDMALTYNLWLYLMENEPDPNGPYHNSVLDVRKNYGVVGFEGRDRAEFSLAPDDMPLGPDRRNAIRYVGEHLGNGGQFFLPVGGYVLTSKCDGTTIHFTVSGEVFRDDERVEVKVFSVPNCRKGR